MSATKEISPIKELAIIAGGGNLPAKLVSACEHQGIKPFIVAFKGHADPELVQGHNHMWARLGGAGKVLKTLKAHNIRDVVMIGSIHRPGFSEIRPDLKVAEFFARVGIKALGDNDLLTMIRRFLEDEGLRVHGAHKFATELLAPKGVLGKYEPSKGDMIDIQRGLEVSQQLGRLDVGQSVIVQEGLVLGVEAIEGTDALIARCKGFKRRGRKGVLVKTCKPQQDRDLDLPTIGPQTILQARDSKLAGIAIHADNALILDLEEVIELANKHKMFVIGIEA